MTNSVTLSPIWGPNPAPTSSNRRRAAPAATAQSSDHDALAQSPAHDESSFQDSQQRNSLSVPQHASWNRMLGNSSEIPHDPRAVAHSFSHRRGKRGTVPGECKNGT